MVSLPYALQTKSEYKSAYLLSIPTHKILKGGLLSTAHFNRQRLIYSFRSFSHHFQTSLPMPGSSYASSHPSSSSSRHNTIQNESSFHKSSSSLSLDHSVFPTRPLLLPTRLWCLPVGAGDEGRLLLKPALLTSSRTSSLNFLSSSNFGVNPLSATVFS